MEVDPVLPTRNPDLVVVEVDDTRVVYDPRRREAHLLNLTAGLILDACDGRVTETELGQVLAEAFGVDLAVVAPEVTATLIDLGLRGLLADSPVLDPTGDPRPPEPTPAGDRRWAGVPPPFEVLGTVIELRIEDPALAAVALRVLAPLLADTTTGSTDSTDSAAVRIDLVTGDDGTFRLLRADREVVRTDDRPAALSHLLAELNQQAVGGTTDAVLLHAAAVRGPAGIAVLPADSESGKSTLAAALVRAGLRYLTDEAVGIDLATGAVRVYPRAIGLGSGSWPLLPEAAPPAAEVDAGFFADEWHVDPRRLHPDALDGLTDLRGGDADNPIVLVAFPTYDPTEVTRLEPAARAPALLMLLHNAFNLAELPDGGAAGVAALDRLSRRAELARLISSDLDAAVELIVDRLGASTVAPA